MTSQRRISCSGAHTLGQSPASSIGEMSSGDGLGSFFAINTQIVGDLNDLGGSAFRKVSIECVLHGRSLILVGYTESRRIDNMVRTNYVNEYYLSQISIVFVRDILPLESQYFQRFQAIVSCFLIARIQGYPVLSDTASCTSTDPLKKKNCCSLNIFQILLYSN